TEEKSVVDTTRRKIVVLVTAASLLVLLAPWPSAYAGGAPGGARIAVAAESQVIGLEQAIQMVKRVYPEVSKLDQLGKVYDPQSDPYWFDLMGGYGGRGGESERSAKVPPPLMPEEQKAQSSAADDARQLAEQAVALGILEADEDFAPARPVTRVARN
ncbi:MAG: hypothetical protein H5T99_00855, partial [Moorella sp. (in: Bacteria)]|nr:hypothetical protein [Moorella sp. (in: firmicutes)]